MSIVTLGLLALLALLSVLSSSQYGLGTSKDEIKHGGLKLFLLDENDSYTVKLRSLDLKTQDPKNEGQLGILNEICSKFGFTVIGPAGPSKSAITVNKPSGLVALRDISELKRVRRNDAGELCEALNESLKSGGYDGAICEHSPLKLRTLRGIIPSEHDNSKVSFDYLRLFPMLYSSSSSTGRHSHNRYRAGEDPDAVAERTRVKKALNVRDPRFNDQWHLFNTRVPGHDLRVSAPWLEGLNGKDVTVAIIDDGVDFSHPDFTDAEQKEGSVDLTTPSKIVRDDTTSPPTLDLGYLISLRAPKQAHGTRCAAEIAARPNEFCGVGVAYRALLSSIRLIDENSSVTDAREASAISYMTNINDIYTCSWGPLDNGSTVEGPGILTKDAMMENVTNGRKGLGSIYVFASGNGLRHGDDCNYDGYVNDVRTITIASIDMFDRHPPYSEECPANLAVTYSSINGADGAIATSDVGGGCGYQTGTSASAPIAAALYAIALQTRSDLSWRDIQQLTILSAVPVTLSDESWLRNASGLLYSNRFGYGKLTADYVVKVAKVLKKLRGQTTYAIPSPKIITGDLPIYSPYKATKVPIRITPSDVKSSGIVGLEHVGVTLSLDYPVRGMLEYYLVSPSGTISKLASARFRDKSPDGLDSWTFTSAAFWGEPILGDWTLIITPIPISEEPDYYVSRYRSIFPSFSNNKRMGALRFLSLSLWGEEGKEGESSTFTENVKVARNIRNYDSFEIERDLSKYSPYIFNEKFYESGSVSSPGQFRGSSNLPITFIIVAVISLVLVVIAALCAISSSRNRPKNPRSLLSADPGDPFGPTQRPPAFSHPTNYNPVNRPPPLTYDPITTNNAPSYHHPYTTSISPPNENDVYYTTYGLNGYQKLP